MSLTTYRRKRKFNQTPEPMGDKVPTERRLSFVVQKHVASRLHYDFRLEVDGVLKSWAMPKGPSLDPRMRRLAVMVEDHPLDYGEFEGAIPSGNYGAGEVEVWDTGTYEVSGGQEALIRGIEQGRLTFVLRGHKLRGAFSMFRFRGERQWLMVKRRDKYVSAEDPTIDARSVLTHRALTDEGEWVKATSVHARRKPIDGLTRKR